MVFALHIISGLFHWRSRCTAQIAVFVDVVALIVGFIAIVDREKVHTRRQVHTILAVLNHKRMRRRLGVVLGMNALSRLSRLETRHSHKAVVDIGVKGLAARQRDAHLVVTGLERRKRKVTTRRATVLLSDKIVATGTIRLVQMHVSVNDTTVATVKLAVVVRVVDDAARDSGALAHPGTVTLAAARVLVNVAAHRLARGRVVQRRTARADAALAPERAHQARQAQRAVVIAALERAEVVVRRRRIRAIVIVVAMAVMMITFGIRLVMMAVRTTALSNRRFGRRCRQRRRRRIRIRALFFGRRSVVVDTRDRRRQHHALAVLANAHGIRVLTLGLLIARWGLELARRTALADLAVIRLARRLEALEVTADTTARRCRRHRAIVTVAAAGTLMRRLACVLVRAL